MVTFILIVDLLWTSCHYSSLRHGRVPADLVLGGGAGGAPVRALLRHKDVFFPPGGVGYGIWTDVAGACLAGIVAATGGFWGKQN